MALTVAQLLSAIRAVPEGEAADASITAIGTRLLAVGRAMVDSYAPNAPEDVRDEAVVRVAGYLYDAPNVTRTGVAWNESGARSLVDPWVERGVAPIDFDVSAVTAATAAAGVDEEAVEAIVRRLVADWAEQGNAEDIPLDKLGNAPSGGGGGLSQAQVQQIAEDAPTAVAARELEANLRYTRDWFAQRNIRLSRTNAFASLGSPTTINAPRGDEKVIITIGSDTITLNRQLLTQHGTVTLDDSPSSSNAAVFRLGAATYWLANLPRQHLAIASDTAGQLMGIRIQHSYIDLEAFARQSSATKLPKAKLPDISYNDLADKPTIPAGGLDQAAVDARVQAGVSDWAEEGNTDAIPAGKLSNAPAGSGGGLNQAAVDARIAQPARAGDTSRWPDSKMPVDLEALDERVRAGYGWRSPNTLLVAPLKSTPYTLAQAEAATYAQMLPEQSPAVVNQYVAVRVPVSFFRQQGSDYDRLAAALRLVNANEPGEGWVVRLGGGVDYDPILNPAGPDPYIYYTVPIPNVGVGERVQAQYDGPLELTNTILQLPAVVQRISQAGLITLVEGAINPPALTNLSGDHNGLRTAFAPVFDLDTHPHGVFEFELVLRFTGNQVPTNLSFAADGVTSTGRETGLAAATEIAASAAVAGQNAGGVKPIEIPLYSGSTEVGSFELWISRDAQNQLAYRLIYEGGTHSIAGSTSVAATLYAYFQKADAPAAPAAMAAVTEIFSGNVDITTANSFQDTGGNLPADYATGLFIANIGGQIAPAALLFGGEIHGATVGAAVAGYLGADYTLRAGSTQQTTFWFAATTARDLLIACSRTNRDPTPLKIWRLG